MPKPIDVMIVEDEPATRARLVAAVDAHPDIVVSGAVATLAEARTALAAHAPRVLLCDLGLPDGSGIELIRSVSASHPTTLAMVLSALGDEQSVIEAIMAGAKGYLLKDDAGTSICESILKIDDGGSPISASIARYLLVKLQGAASPQPLAVGLLTEREVEVLELVAQGYRSQEIAERLHLSYHTIVHHIRHVYDKLAVNSRSQAIGRASELGLLTSRRNPSG